jgi:hypothetical protein
MSLRPARSGASLQDQSQPIASSAALNAAISKSHDGLIG